MTQRPLPLPVLLALGVVALIVLLAVTILGSGDRHIGVLLGARFHHTAWRPTGPPPFTRRSELVATVLASSDSRAIVVGSRSGPMAVVFEPDVHIVDQNSQPRNPQDLRSGDRIVVYGWLGGRQRTNRLRTFHAEGIEQLPPPPALPIFRP